MELLANVNWEDLLQTYGYWAILLGAFLEGETIVVLAGLFVAGGKMSFWWVVLAAFIGCTLSDQLMFAIGRFKGSVFLERSPRLNRKRKKVSKLLEKYDLFLILGFRFVYGFRNITPIILGMSHIKYWRFLLLNLLGAAVWVVLFTAAGFYFGQVINQIIKACGLTVLLLIIAGAIGGGVTFLILRRKKRRAKLLKTTAPLSNEEEEKEAEDA